MNAIHSLMDRAIARRVFHSACLLVAHQGQPILHQAYGRARLDGIFDLASLTKPLATTMVLMQLTSRGVLSPRHQLIDLLPEIKQPEVRRLRLEHLLAHTGGLVAWCPFYEQARQLPPSHRRRAVRRQTASIPILFPPARQMIYSDLGFILLDWAVERCTGTRLDRLAEQLLYQPLGLSRTFFVDLHRPWGKEKQQRFARLLVPTERCSWRKRRLRGEVHDDNCWVMGGISGHAGLFSTAYEVHLLARELVAAYHGARSIFDPRVTRDFLTTYPLKSSTRVLGWDTPSPHDSSSGHFFSARSVGHLGYTGTSLWIDLHRRLWVVLLTNRVYYGREPNRLRPFRPKLHDAIMRAIGSVG